MKIIKESNDEKIYWFAIYITPDKKKKGILFIPKSQDYDEIEEEADMLIPEPYIKLRIGSVGRKGSYSFNDLVDVGYTVIEESIKRLGNKTYYDFDDMSKNDAKHLVSDAIDAGKGVTITTYNFPKW